MSGYTPKSARPYMPKSAVPVGDNEPQVGAGETFLNRAVNAVPLGRLLTDAGSTAVMQTAKALGVGEAGAKLTPQAQAELQAMGQDTSQPESTIPGVVDTYRQARDTRAERTEAGSHQNPWAGRLGTGVGFGLSILAPLPKVPGAGLGSSMATGAGYGALEGLTNGKADLTRGEVGQALKDTAEGAGYGAGMGVLGHGLMRMGQRGIRALRNARGDLVGQETAALQEAAQEGQEQLAGEVAKHRDMVGKARGMMSKDFAARDAAAAEDAAAMERQHGQALELNKKVDARGVLARARGQSAPPAPEADPSTKVLEGYAGKAGERRAVNYDRVKQYRADIHDPDMDTQASSDLQKYIDDNKDAVDAPAQFRRRFIERYLRENHGDDVAERLMRDRVSPDGRSILPRRPTSDVGGVESSAPKPGGSVPSMAEEAEAAMAARRQELGPGQVQQELQLEPAAEPARVRPLDAPWMPKSARPITEPPLTRPPVRRAGVAPHALGVDGKRGPLSMEPTPTGSPAAERSMAAPVDAPLPPDPATRATHVPDLRRPVPLPPPAPEASTVNLKPQLPAGSPATPASAPAPQSEIQDVTRLAGPQDVGALAGERALARENGALGAVARAGYEGVKNGKSTLGALVGGLGGITKEALKDPAVKAKALSMAKLHLLAQINPELFARVGSTLASAAATGDESRYRAQKYLQIRTHPELRAAEQQAGERAARLSDEQLMALIANGSAQ